MHTYSPPGRTVCGTTGASHPSVGAGDGAPGIILGTPLGTAHGISDGVGVGIALGTPAGMAVGTEVGTAHTTATIAGEATTTVHRTTLSVVSQAHVATTPALPAEAVQVAPA